MDQKHYLFYQKQSIGTFWKNSFHLEKFFLICFLLFSLFMAGGFIYITFCSTDPAVAQKQSIGTFWKNSFHLEKFFLICFLLFSLFMAGGFIYITFCSTDPAVAAPLLASVWLFLFPGMTFFCHRTVKSYWVFFQEHLLGIFSATYCNESRKLRILHS